MSRYFFSPRSRERETLPMIGPSVIERDGPLRIEVADQIGALRLFPGDQLTSAHHQLLGNHILCLYGAQRKLLLVDLHDLTPA